MRKIKAIKTESGISPDWPKGESFPPNDPNIEGMIGGEDGYIIYETGDELPECIRPKLHILRELPDETTLWRYVDFPRLYSLVTKKALYFTPGYVLRDLEPYEFRVPVSLSASSKDAWIASYAKQFPDDTEGKKLFDSLEQGMEEHLLYMQGISCWHINENENNALWQVFVPGGGVAIKTTLGRLKTSLNCRRRSIFADIVEYIDHDSEGYKTHPSARGFEQIYHKAKFFEYERELRLALKYDQNIKQFELSDAATKEILPEQLEAITEHLTIQREEFLRTGPFVPVDLPTLIAEIVVGPRLGSWFYELVCDLVQSNISADIPIRRSAIDKWGSR